MTYAEYRQQNSTSPLLNLMGGNDAVTNYAYFINNQQKILDQLKKEVEQELEKALKDVCAALQQ